MKKLMIPFILVLCSTGAFSQLRGNAEMLKKEMPNSYAAIKTFAVTKWATDHGMVVFEINKQSEAMVEVLLMENKIQSIFNKAYTKWTAQDVADIKISENPTTDWGMVLWEYKKQAKAASSY